RAGTEHPETGGWWGRVATVVDRRYRRVWAVTAVALLACIAFVPGLKAHGTTPSDIFLTKVDSVAGQHLLDDHFPGGTGSPTWIMTNAARATQVQAAAREVPGVASVGTPEEGADGSRMRIRTVLDASAGSPAAMETVQRIRDAVHAVDGAAA